MGIILRKVRVNDVASIVRPVYAEESNAFLSQYHQSAGNGLDVCVNKTVENIGENLFFKIESQDGSLVGFMSTASINGVDAMPSFHVRQQYRTAPYLAAFWQLVDETFENEFFTSVGSDNIPAYQHLVKNNFIVVNQTQSDGKDFIILMKPKTL